MNDDFNTDAIGFYALFSRNDFNSFINLMFDADGHRKYLMLLNESDFSFSGDELKAVYDQRGRCVVALQAVSDWFEEGGDIYQTLLGNIGDPQAFQDAFEDNIEEVQGVAEMFAGKAYQEIIQLAGTYHAQSERRAMRLPNEVAERFQTFVKQYQLGQEICNGLLDIRSAMGIEAEAIDFPPVPDDVLLIKRGFDPETDDPTNVRVLEFKGR